MTLKALPIFKLRSGSIVAHRSLDENGGVAKHGRVEETVDGKLVIAHFEDEPALVGFDSREVQRLIMFPGLSRGPIMLYGHHLWSVLKMPFRLAWQSVRG